MGPGAPRAVAAAPTGLPHTPQKRNPAWTGAPQEPQLAPPGACARRGAPQSRQNAKLGSFSRPQRGHRVGFDMRTAS